MIRWNSFNAFGFATIAISLMLRLEPQEVGILIASVRQVAAGGHIALLRLARGLGVRSRGVSATYGGLGHERNPGDASGYAERLDSMMGSVGALR